METLRWGSITLSVDAGKIYTFDGMDWSMGYKVKEKEVSKKKPSLSGKGPNLEQINITIKLSSALGVDPASEIGKWRAECNKAGHYDLYIGGERIGDTGSTFYIKTLKVADTQWGLNARMQSATMSVSFEEVPKKTKKKKSSSGGGGKSGSGSKNKPKPSNSVKPSGGSSSSGNSTPITERYRDDRTRNGHQITLG